ncbi:hypothetical protein AVEN_193517-1, partial [Araneus ventricosus]
EETTFVHRFIRPRWPSGKIPTSNRMVAGSKPDSAEDPPCMGPAARKIIRSGRMPSRLCSAEVWRGGPRHLTAVQNDDVRPKIPLLLLQNGTLI